MKITAERKSQFSNTIRISENCRYFVDQDCKPVFWLGTTQWQIFRDHSLPEAELILEKSKINGFNFIQAMFLGVGDGTKPNINGEDSWKNDNPVTPNEAYFEHVDSIIKVACEKNLVFVAGIYHQTMGNRINISNARTWARWIAERYRDTPNLIWSMYPRSESEYVPLLRELAKGLREGDGGFHLITVHPDPSPATSSTYLHNEDWLDFNSMQTWRYMELFYSMITHDYNLTPVKPVVMAEGAYEQGTEYGFDVTPLWIRRQAYYSYLIGAHHSYGHNDSWRLLSTWKKALEAPGAKQMGILKKIFLDLDEWWNIVPDQSIFKSGGQTEGKLLNLAARHRDGKWMLAYFADKASFKINMDKIAAGNKAEAFWIDPRNGNSISIGSYTTEGVRPFSTPKEWEDSLLLLKAKK